MVRAYIPQSSGGSIDANTIHIPQGTIPGGVPAGASMEYEDNVTMLYEDSTTMEYEG